MRRRARSAAAGAKISQVRIARQTRKQVRGVAVHVAFAVGNLKGGRARAVATFADARTGRPLKDRDGRYRAPDGRVAFRHLGRARREDAWSVKFMEGLAADGGVPPASP